MTALRDEDGAWTYGELAGYSRRAARWLAANGVRPGHRVLVKIPNSRLFVALLYGTLRLGAVFVPISPMMRPFHYEDVLVDAAPELIITEEDDSSPIFATYSARSLDEVAAELEQLAEPESWQDRAAPDDIALLIYTSGSTSRPKGVACPHRQVMFAVSAVGEMLGYRPDDIVYSRLPFSFDYGLYQIFLCTMAGAELVVSARAPEIAALRTARDCGATVMPLLPLFARNLIALAERDRRPTRLRMFTNTGAALPKATVAALHELFAPASVVLMYGMTECKRITIADPESALVRPDTVGRPLPDTDVWIIAEDGTRARQGEVGEILVAGGHVMSGYWRSPELTRQRFRTDPITGRTVLHTGDYGYLAADGYLYLVGRRDDIFKRRGLRTSTYEVEAAALDVPGVRQAAVRAPDGADPLTVWVAADLPAAEVLAGIAERLERPKVPDRCVVLAELPRTSNGKVDKNRLADLDPDGAA